MKNSFAIQLLGSLLGLSVLVHISSLFAQDKETMQSAQPEQEVAYGIGLVQVQPQQSDLDQLFEHLKDETNMCVTHAGKGSLTGLDNVVHWDSPRSEDAKSPQFLIFRPIHNHTGGFNIVLGRYNGEDPEEIFYYYTLSQLKNDGGSMEYMIQASTVTDTVETHTVVETIMNSAEMQLAMTKFYDRIEQCKDVAGLTYGETTHGRESIMKVMQGF